MLSPQQPWQHTKSPRVSSLSFHRCVITSMIILIRKMASQEDIIYYMKIFYSINFFIKRL